MIDSAVAAALGPLVQTLDRLGVRYYLGGSLASSAHGVARASLDADVVVFLGPSTTPVCYHDDLVPGGVASRHMRLNQHRAVRTPFQIAHLLQVPRFPRHHGRDSN